MFRKFLGSFGVFALLALVGCGGGSSSTPSTPTTPTTPTQTNRSPVINSLTITPSFGISQLTSFTYNASASDPDGDPITYSWDLAGNAASGPVGTITFGNGGTGVIRVTATDSKGATATDTRTIVVGSMTGNWSFFVPGQGTLLLGLSQTNTFVTGSFVVAPGGFGNVSSGVSGRTDPAQPGSINGNGTVVIRLKVGQFTDFTMTGTMDSTGQRVTGSINGSGFSGQPFTMTKQ
jgi:PKD domain.